MYKSRKAEENSILNRTAISSVLAENTNTVFEREIDNYTRMLEQDKRRFFRLQESRGDVLKEFACKSRELEGLKSKQFKTETLRRKNEMKLLEKELTQTISSYNDVLALNKSFKAEIEELRKEKFNQKEALKRLTLRTQEFNALIMEKEGEIAEKKEQYLANKQQILRLKGENENEARGFREEVGAGRNNLDLNRSGHFLKRKSESAQKNEATDTQPLVKYRLRQVISQNKERIRIVEQYRKSMSAIWKSFEEIKEESGTLDLEEITSVFLKHEQQNHFIYQYINKLNKEIDDLHDDKADLAARIDAQQQLNLLHLAQLNVSPHQETQRELAAHFLHDCNHRIEEFQNLLTDSAPLIKQLRETFGLEEEELTQFNLRQQLSKIEELINQFYPSEETHYPLKEEATKYTRVPPVVSEEVRDKEERLFDGEKLRQFASDYWEKRKGK